LEEKTMKKRSLFAAVAMLIVSAIVLTGSTYAWFASAGNAYVGKATAGISASDEGNIQVKTGSLSWRQTLTGDQLVANLPKTLAAVDFNPQVSTSQIKTLDYDGTYYTNIDNGSLSSVLSYTWQVRATNPGSNTTINIPVTFACGGTTPALVGMIQVVETSQWFTYGNTSFTGLGNVELATESGNKPGIIDSADTCTPATPTWGSTVTANTLTNTIQIVGSQEHPLQDGYTINVWVWAPGQSEDCTGSVDISAAQNNLGGFTFGDSEGPIYLS
jgi:hypothetical protein